MCGIIGLVYSDTKSHVNQALVDGLTILQHRGQDAAGIVTESNKRLNLMKNTGCVSEVFTQDNMVSLRGNIGVGHVRYPTAGGGRSCEAQPLYTNFPFGIAIAHNGNLINACELGDQMRQNYRHVNTNSDSEVLLNVFADELQRRQMAAITPDDIFDSVRVLMRRCKGAYAVVILINRLGLLAFRDPHGIRPLCFGSRETATGVDYAVASESVAIDALDPYNPFSLQRDVRAGEAVFVSNAGQIFTQDLCIDSVFAPCIFEYVYFARPDSILDGVPVYAARARMGEKLAHHLLTQFDTETATTTAPNTINGGHYLDTTSHPLDIDVVIPIPETSRTAALECARILHLPYREGFIKNRYIARTFIMPGQEMRRKTVRLKLNTIKSEFKNKVVLLIDDSIVRGTTAKELIQMARDAGARKVYFASAAPPVRHCNVYGIDIPTRRELVAHHRTVDEVCATLGADRVFYNSLEDICDAVRGLNPSLHNNTSSFECSCFDGQYVTPEVDAAYLHALEESRGGGRRGACTSEGVQGQAVSQGVNEVNEEVQEFGERVNASTANADERCSTSASNQLLPTHAAAQNTGLPSSASTASSMCESIYNDG